MVSSVIFQKSCVLHHFHRYSLMPNSRIHWYLQEGEAFFLPLEFCISKLIFFEYLMWFEAASTPNFIFSHLQWHLLAILAKSLIRVSRWLNRKAKAQTYCSSRGLSSLFRSVASRACQKFQEHIRKVASRACQKFEEHIRKVASKACQKIQERGRSVASRACQKFQEHIRKVASRACQKIQEHVRSVASRACGKFQERVRSVDQERVRSSKHKRKYETKKTRTREEHDFTLPSPPNVYPCTCVGC